MHNPTKHYVNLTPHVIHVYTQDEDRILFSVEPSGELARVDEFRSSLAEIDNIPVYRISYGDVVGLPDPKHNTIYLVSSMVLARVKNRNDVFSPANPVRDAKGNIIGCKALSAAPVE